MSDRLVRCRSSSDAFAPRTHLQHPPPLPLRLPPVTRTHTRRARTPRPGRGSASARRVKPAPQSCAAASTALTVAVSPPHPPVRPPEWMFVRPEPVPLVLGGSPSAAGAPREKTPDLGLAFRVPSWPRRHREGGPQSSTSSSSSQPLAC